jgi:hypothetical protein
MVLRIIGLDRCLNLGDFSKRKSMRKGYTLKRSSILVPGLNSMFPSFSSVSSPSRLGHDINEI